MSKRPALPADFLDHAGLNRQHVFDLQALPAEIADRIETRAGECQLILFGHGGRRLWECVQASDIGGENPIDDYSMRTVAQWFAEHLPSRHFRFIFPGDQPIGLQALGELAGWHRPSPIMVGVDRQWGSWYAYRAVVVADTNFQPSRVLIDRSPCMECPGQPCIAACPAGALHAGHFDLETCSRFRLKPASPCSHGCMARLACPVGSEHRYDDAQIRHSYTRSLTVIRQYYC
ncbi:MAG: hypothetical protein KGP14_02080 [Betaproteobacteria bacterium]|nr:hypothetical protein [Betaproteobacteria bacterium]